jgi:hypothetical protein
MMSSPARRLVALAACTAAFAATAQSIDVPNGRPPVASSASEPLQLVQVHGAGGPFEGPHTPRTGAYSIKHEGDIAIMARCLEGGTVFVSRASLDRMPGSTPAQRQDAALRQSCRDVDLTK